jgi:hypothetical protein
VSTSQLLDSSNSAGRVASSTSIPRRARDASDQALDVAALARVRSAGRFAVGARRAHRALRQRGEPGQRLEKLGRKPRSIVINRADPAPAPYVQALLASPSLPVAVAEALAALEEEREQRTGAADRLAADLAAHLRGVPQVRLSFLELPAPEAIVLALSEELAPHLDTLLPAPVR